MAASTVHKAEHLPGLFLAVEDARSKELQNIQSIDDWIITTRAVGLNHWG
jgi:hypothetical protein